MTPNVLRNIGPLRQIGFVRKYRGKSKGDISPAIPFPADVTYL